MKPQVSLESKRFRKKPQFSHAVSALAPYVSFTYHPETEEIETWDNPKVGYPDGLGIAQPTKVQINTKLAELQAEWETEAYARNRSSDYPSPGDQMDMIYKDMKNSTTTHADAVEAVKTKWPKDNSGPIE